MVDYNGLENRRAERHRGFESLSLRSNYAKAEDTAALYWHAVSFYFPTQQPRATLYTPSDQHRKNGQPRTVHIHKKNKKTDTRLLNVAENK